MFIKNILLYGHRQNNPHLSNIFINEKGTLKIFNESNITADSVNATDVINQKEIYFDAQGNYALMPGWLDAHVHGYGGHDFADADEINLPIITQALGNSGLSYCMATLVSLNYLQLKKSLAAIDHYYVEQNKNPRTGHCNIVGIHLEGPFIAKNCKGAHDERVLQKKINIEILSDIIQAAPHITQWKITLAPEIEGAIDFIRDAQNFFKDTNISMKIFLGHTNAEEHYIDQAIRAGAIGFTHLGNANQETAQRCCGYQLNENTLTSNVVRWTIKNSDKHFFAELIADGQHLSTDFIQFITHKLKDKILLITDALGPSGLIDGEYRFGSLSVIKQGEKFMLKNDKNKLAGSAASLATIAEKFSQIFLPEYHPLDALYRATVINPRKSSLDQKITLPDEQNFVIVDKQGRQKLSICNGKLTKDYLFTKK